MVNANFEHLLPQTQMEATIRGWLHDDMPGFDVGGHVVGDSHKQAKLLLKSPGIFAGKPFCQAVFDVLGCTIAWSDDYQEGDFLDPSGDDQKTICLAIVSGPVHKILQGERTALNTLSRCSGVATLSHIAVTQVQSLGWKGHIAGTRKTTPGFRVVEKYGLLVGGAATHRLDLSQMVMLKDNHIWATGSITNAVLKAKTSAGFSQKIEVECQSLEEAVEAASAGADIVMLDNFEPHRLKQDAAVFKQKFPHVLVEASGGITTETMSEYVCEHVDIISQGRLTQGYPCLDYSLKIVH